MTTETPRDMLISGAQLIELETHGFLPASGFIKLIDQGVVPKAPTGDLQGFYPINLTLDARGVPTEAERLSDGFLTGVIAVYADRVVLAWMKGMIRTKVSSVTIDRATITGTVSITMGDVPGLDLKFDDGRVISLVFAPRLDVKLTTSWCDELSTALDGDGGNGADADTPTGPSEPSPV